ncbi:MAG TPA: VCBS repeat-containing protein, partial [Armatimonadota bacterium]|nr:VCBS repeat-containing protein [Armatimonadota bacterium]
PEVHFFNRHQIAGTTWVGMHGEYLLRNCKLTDEQRALADDWVAHATRYAERLAESYWYADGVQLLNDEGEMVLRYALRTGEMKYVDNGSLQALADYWVANIGSTGGLASNGHNANTKQLAFGGEVLNAADWLYPGSGYAAFRRRQQRWPYNSFLLHMGGWQGAPVPWWNFERQPSGGWEALRDSATGVTVLPLGETLYDYMHANPNRWQGGYQRTPGRYVVDPISHDHSFKRITLRSGLERDDAFVVIDGLQGMEWSYDDINAIVRFDALGEHLLKSQWDARNVESRLEMNTLFVSSGKPGAKQSVASEIVGNDLATLSLQANQHDGVTWTRHIRWEGGHWFVVSDEVDAHEEGDYFLAQTWLSHHAFEIDGAGATAQANDVTLHIIGTPERSVSPCEEGVRQTMHAHLSPGEPITLQTLIYATDSEHPKPRTPTLKPARSSSSGAGAQLAEWPVAERLDLPPPLAPIPPYGPIPFALDAALTAPPIAVDFDGTGRPDIAIATEKAITVYRPDGSVRWRRDLTNSANALSAGDLDGDGRVELGLSLHNWAMVLNHAGDAVIDEEVYRYTGTGGAFGDVDGDGMAEFVAVTTSGVNVLRPGRPRQTIGFGSFLGVSPCRVWLRDLDGDGAAECYVGGGGSDLACYDLKAMRCRWSFADSPIHPRDAAMLDIDGDGSPEIVGGGQDGFLYVLGADGAFRFSQSFGAAITRLQPLPDARLAVGLRT